MSPSLEDAFATVRKLVADFTSNRGHHQSPNYQEAELRQDFLDKFLTALGWDVNHSIQKNPFAQEVKVERGVGAGASQRRADYAFYVAPNFRDVRFFVEAKKPFGDLATRDNCFQAIRYGWNAQTPVAALTNFEEFQILDCRYKPDIDTATTHVLLRFGLDDYLNKEKFSFLYYLLSREAVAEGAFDRYADALPTKRGKAVQRGLFKGGYQSIDEAFLEELDQYRALLARAFKNPNPDLDGTALTELTQRTIDRLVFMRFLEDKLIHPSRLVSAFGDAGTAWHDFIAASRRLDATYNGIVFKRHALLDAPGFTVDDDIFSDICERLSHVNSPYDFNTIPIHILGSIYERFLGNVIVATEKRAHLEEKPDVRKAGGVYYTPEYIVRYIVDNTVGALVGDKSPAEIAAMRFADIACGSGSFLLGVYDVLLSRYREWYASHPDKAKRDGCVQHDDGAWHLSLRQKREILVNSIYGVDIDSQAVEVAQLSLYLKLLEEETTATARNYQLEFHETLLPSLARNIVCGNSLVGSEILAGQLFAGDEERSLNAMDFEARFPAIFKRLTPSTKGGVGATAASRTKKGDTGEAAAHEPPSLAGGFDAIVGNPPYRLLQPHDTSQTLLGYLRKAYVGAADYKIDLFHLFLQRAVSLVRPGGYQSYIIPTTLLNNVYAESLRDWLAARCRIEQICVAKGRVFADADVHTSVVILRSEPNPAARRKNVVQTTTAMNPKFVSARHSYRATPQQVFGQLPGHVWNIMVDEGNRSLVTRLMRDFIPLRKVARINRGLVTGARDKYFAATKKSDKYVPIITGSDVYRYGTKAHSEYLLFERPKAGGGCWDREVHFADHKLVIRQIGEKPMASIVLSPLAVTVNIFTIMAANIETELFILGILNSKLMTFFWRTMFADFKASFPQVTIFSLEQIPVPDIGVSDDTSKAKRGRLTALVESMLGCQTELAKARTDKDVSFYEGKCGTLDRQIDEAVYELYGLSPAEVEVVEATCAT